MRNAILAFIGLMALCNSSYAQYDVQYKEKFDLVRRNLGSGRTGEAFALLQDLYALDTANYYTNYLMGVCYTEQEIININSVRHLEYATQNVMDVYTYIPYTEKRAPVYAWYYLTKAYSQNGMCVEAKKASEMFYEIYGQMELDFFVINIQKFLIQCIDQSYARIQRKSRKNLVTKDINYTTLSPLYGVQVGAFDKLIPIKESFDDLKNVEAFMDKEGVIRYVVGHFSFRKQAESLLEVIREKGYGDAFIVDVNKEKRFSREVVIFDNQSFKAHILGDIEFKVQIGAFYNTDSIPNILAQVYIKLEDVQENPEGELTTLTAGSFDQYEKAIVHRNELIKMGIPGAFVVAYNQGNKISIQAAQKYIERRSGSKEN